jgi:hypothetical protein
MVSDQEYLKGTCPRNMFFGMSLHVLTFFYIFLYLDLHVSIFFSFLLLYMKLQVSIYIFFFL